MRAKPLSILFLGLACAVGAYVFSSPLVQKQETPTPPNVQNTELPVTTYDPNYRGTDMADRRSALSNSVTAQAIEARTAAGAPISDSTDRTENEKDASPKKKYGSVTDASSEPTFTPPCSECKTDPINTLLSETPINGIARINRLRELLINTGEFRNVRDKLALELFNQFNTNRSTTVLDEIVSLGNENAVELMLKLSSIASTHGDANLATAITESLSKLDSPSGFLAILTKTQTSSNGILGMSRSRTDTFIQDLQKTQSNQRSIGSSLASAQLATSSPNGLVTSLIQNNAYAQKSLYEQYSKTGNVPLAAHFLDQLSTSKSNDALDALLDLSAGAKTESEQANFATRISEFIRRNPSEAVVGRLSDIIQSTGSTLTAKELARRELSNIAYANNAASTYAANTAQKLVSTK